MKLKTTGKSAIKWAPQALRPLVSCLLSPVSYKRGTPMRIVTRPDFDGIVCAVLLRQALDESLPICWLEPNAIQSGKVGYPGW